MIPLLISEKKILKKEIKESKAIIKKNLGHIYLKKILASFWFIILLIDGAIKQDWNKITPIIIAELK